MSVQKTYSYRQCFGQNEQLQLHILSYVCLFVQEGFMFSITDFEMLGEKRACKYKTVSAYLFPVLPCPSHHAQHLLAPNLLGPDHALHLHKLLLSGLNRDQRDCKHDVIEISLVKMYHCHLCSIYIVMLL